MAHTRKVLFLCSQNRLRSPTAEVIFSQEPGLEVLSAGLNNDAESPTTPELIEWSDIIFIMDRTHRNRLSKKFKKYINSQKVICLNIPDDYEFMDPELIKLLNERVSKHLGIYRH